tara:strand:+ start:322 stop:540 length:219 start_codon:yes stop_codon:yes gene_type:complete
MAIETWILDGVKELNGLNIKNNIVHQRKISFKPIYVDLNGTQRVGQQISILYVNPKLDLLLKKLWEKYNYHT